MCRQNVRRQSLDRESVITKGCSRHLPHPRNTYFVFSERKCLRGVCVKIHDIESGSRGPLLLHYTVCERHDINSMQIRTVPAVRIINHGKLAIVSPFFSPEYSLSIFRISIAVDWKFSTSNLEIHIRFSKFESIEHRLSRV